MIEIRGIKPYRPGRKSLIDYTDGGALGGTLCGFANKDHPENPIQSGIDDNAIWFVPGQPADKNHSPAGYSPVLPEGN